MTNENPLIVDPEDVSGQRTEAAVHGVLLAAGTSNRFGDANKLLATIDGEPLVRHAVRTFTRSVLNGTTVVLGHEADRVRSALENLAVDIRINESYERGQSTSVHTGVLAAIQREADAVVVGLGDMPDVSVETVNRLVEAYERGAGAALAATYDGERGNPVLFDSKYFDALTEVSGDVGGREILLSSDDAAFIETDDPGVRRDIDRREDFRAARDANREP